MADTGIFATTSQCAYRAGYGASATYTAEAYTNYFIAEAESQINIETGVNYSDTYATLNVDKKYILRKWATALVAIDIINADMRGYGGMTMVQTMLNILKDICNECRALLTKSGKTDMVSSA